MCVCVCVGVTLSDKTAAAAQLPSEHAMQRAVDDIAAQDRIV